MPPFKTRPHVEHEIILLEDAMSPMNRIYEIQQGKHSIRILGSELTSIIAWFENEKNPERGD